MKKEELVNEIICFSNYEKEIEVKLETMAVDLRKSGVPESKILEFKKDFSKILKEEGTDKYRLNLIEKFTVNELKSLLSFYKSAPDVIKRLGEINMSLSEGFISKYMNYLITFLDECEKELDD